MRDEKRQRTIIIGIIIAIVLVLFGTVWALTHRGRSWEIHSTKPQPVTFNVTPGVSAKLYDANNPQEHLEVGEVPPEDKVIQTLKGTQKLTLNPGRYILTTPKTDKYEALWQGVNVMNKPITIEVAPDNTAGTLSNELGEEKAAIMNAIRRDVPNAEDYYVIEGGQLFAQGQWFGVKLTYKGPDPTNSDTLRLVAHKEDNQWKVVTKPPEITVSSKKYPQIPRDVAVGINRL